MSTTILVIGLMVFLAHFLSLQFRRTNIPDVLVLMMLGILIGPLLGVVSPEDFGRVGSLIATIALVVILFEGGTSLNLDILGKSLGTIGLLSFTCFFLTVAIVTLIGLFALQLTLLPAMLLGVTLGGSAPAVVIPMVAALQLSEKSSTVLILESALTDVLCIVGVFALLQIHTQGGVEPGKLVGSVLASLVFAAVIGVLGGIGWLLVLGKVRDFPNTISSTLAYAFIVYGLTELLGFSGAVASLTLGITLTNFEKFGLHRISNVEQKLVPLNEVDLVFYREAVFLLKTYFFVYLGISIRFVDLRLAVASVSMVVLVYAMRLALTRHVFRDSGYSLRDTALTSMMAPKGLAAAVLATLPLKYGIEGGEVIRDVTYMVVLVSIAVTALLVMLYPLNRTQRLYARTLGKPL
ncbi:cation:proton antiporter [Sideroxydans lithotrophicus]|uniref:Sodium/hydrogen exchanger n=1 Tax=Sideroxydans lithotrophicus (strain ES-1) TaxID=580332 RepID=D5CPU5_SIDLE|nr:cation:proton antiporter [Sideroxydans lithotrophicus]ADE13090.1 sodium/hydrogen exchanger [Sideroxydans lithotrophicus ES-1]